MAAKQVGPSAVLPRCELLTALLKVAVNLDGSPLLVMNLRSGVCQNVIPVLMAQLKSL